MTEPDPTASPAVPQESPFDPVGVSWSMVSGRLATVRRLLLISLTGVITVAVLVAGAIWSLPVLLPAAALVVVAAVTGWGWWLIGRQVQLLGYAERVEDLLVRRGALFRRIVVVPYGRMQYVDVSAGPLDRAFGLARVRLHTASADTDASVPGLVPGEAARLRDRLSALGQSRLAGL